MPHRSVSLPMGPAGVGAVSVSQPQPNVQQQTPQHNGSFPASSPRSQELPQIQQAKLAGTTPITTPGATFAGSSPNLTSTAVVRRSFPGPSDGTVRPLNNVSAMPSIPRPMPTMTLHAARV